MKVDSGKKEVRLRLSEALYPKKIIKKALSDISKEVSVEKREKEGYFLITLKPKEPCDLEELGYEFFNYLLALIKSS